MDAGHAVDPFETLGRFAASTIVDAVLAKAIARIAIPGLLEMAGKFAATATGFPGRWHGVLHPVDGGCRGSGL
jgi:hypothetical protein